MSNKRKPWREVLKVHPAADCFPLLSGEELRAFADKIAKNGLLEPIAIWKENEDANYVLLNGRTRTDALVLLGRKIFCANGEGECVDPHKQIKIGGGTFNIFQLVDTKDPIGYIIAKNVDRRQLSPEDTDEVIEKLLKLDPALSDRRIGAAAGVDHKTVGKRRRDAEERGEIPHAKKRTDTQGRKQPAGKPQSPSPD
jgi:hypothetical protein